MSLQSACTATINFRNRTQQKIGRYEIRNSELNDDVAKLHQLNQTHEMPGEKTYSHGFVIV